MSIASSNTSTMVVEKPTVALPLYQSIPDYNERVYDIIQAYFNNHHTERLVRHQLESYNDFVQIQIEKTIQMFNPMNIRSENDYVAEKGQYFLEIAVHFDNFKMHPPVINENNGSIKKLLPQEAKIRNITYAANMSLDMNIQYIVRNTENMDEPKIITKKIPAVSIGKMPVMVKSAICYLNTHPFPTPLQNTGECNMDCGGYFVIKGSEKTVLGQERTAENKIYCFDGKNTTKWSWMAEYKSIPDYKCISPKQVEMMIHNKTGGIYVQIPRIKIPVELFTLFRAYGITSDKAICEYIVYDVDADKNKQVLEFLLYSVTDGTKYMTQEAALQHIISNVAYTPLNMDRETGQRKKREFTQDVLKNDVFPHCSTIPQKLFLLGLMCSKLIKTRFGWIPQDDRDSYLNKRIELTGTLLNNLFRNYYNKLLKEMQKLIVREINTSSWRSSHDYENILHLNNIYKMIKPTTIENGINRALATGDFSIKQMNSSKVGVAQVLNRLTYPATLSHMRRINTPLDKSGELIPPRRLHTTTWGFLCLTGDTDVLASNRTDMWKIRDMHDGQSVTTVNRSNLNEEPSAIFRHFGKMPDRLFQVITASGRTIKATPEHPLLVRVAPGQYKMKPVQDLQLTDQVVIRHMVQAIPPGYHTTQEAKVHARLVGALLANGLLTEDRVEFHVASEQDAQELGDDVIALGFGNSLLSVRRNDPLWTTSLDNVTLKYLATWSVCSENRAFVDFLNNTLLKPEPSAHPTQIVRVMDPYGEGHGYSRCILGTGTHTIPKWLRTADLAVQREFLSAFQGVSGGTFCKNQGIPTAAVYLGSTYQTAPTPCLPEIEDCMQQVAAMFRAMGIICEVKVYECSSDINRMENVENKSDLYLTFDRSLNMLERYADMIAYTYGEDKRKASAIYIEVVKWIKHGATETEIAEFVKTGVADNGAVCVPLQTLCEVEPEMVYDFTTESDNHSFVASSFVSSNCPIETPEGQSVGVVKNIAYLTHITIPTNSSALYEFVKPFITPLERFSAEGGEAGLPKSYILDKTKVLVNGCWLGVTETPLELYQDLKAKKQAGIINIYTSIVFHYTLNEIQVCNDGGRLVRPLLRVEDNRLLLTDEILRKISDRTLEWNQLFLNSPEIGQAVMEYIDPDEQAFAMIAMKTKKGDTMDVRAHRYTHAEIHPSTIMGILASCIPFPDHNQAPRNTYQCAMQKQAMGIYATNYDKRMDKTGYILTYPMRPLVDTRLMNFIHINRVPSGCQIYVAIMTHTGYNQEDSVLINQGAVDRGLFVTTIFHTEKDEDKNVVRDEVIRCKPDKTKTRGMKFGNYDKLTPKGFIPENTQVENRDILIGKMTPIKENRNDPSKIIKYEDQSKVFRTTEETYVDRNITGRNGDGYNFAKTRTRIFRKPVIGDKFACALPTQQVLTDAGWMDFRQLDVQKHRVATLATDGKLLYEFPKEKFVYDYDGPLVKIQSRVHMICTPNHNLYIQTNREDVTTPHWGMGYELKKAEDVETGLETGAFQSVDFQQVLENGFPDVTYVPGTQDKVKMDEWLPLLGSYFNTARSGSIHISRDEKYRVLYMALKVKQDVFPKYVWKLSQRQCRLLMNALLPASAALSTTPVADTNDLKVYATPSSTLADDVMRLATHCGGSAQIFPQAIASGGNLYSVIVSLAPTTEATVKRGDIKHIHYTGQVYCVEMPTSHLYYFRETPYSPAFLSGNSRSSQKGTLGNLIPEQDMPFTKNGLRPDLILNPHAIPSRMTIAQLKETLLGKVLVELGMFGDGTAFNEDLTIPNISAELQKLGFESYGNEIMYDGMTGKQMEMSVFMGPVFYQRLKHMVNDKQHSRAIGPMVNLTRQPAEGRCRDGGFRIGEMERDVMIAHGMSEFCKDRLMDASDKYSMHVCKTCGMVAGYNDGKMRKPECLEGMTVHLCNTCQNRTEFARIEVPYTYKLLTQELQTINIVPRYITGI